MSKLKKRLDAEVDRHNNTASISWDHPDPLLIARQDPNEYKALICALFAYGNVQQIVKFLDSLDFSLLDASEAQIQSHFSKHYYRFQNAQDVQNIFITLRRLKLQGSLESIFAQAYKQDHQVLDGVYALIDAMRRINPYESKGYDFLIGKPKQNSPYKRWLMYLRWMVRQDAVDLGLWSSVDKKDLLLPLDTHTFKVGQKLGLLKRKSYDLKAVLEISAALKKLDPLDPIQYDFALYRLGQNKEI